MRGIGNLKQSAKGQASFMVPRPLHTQQTETTYLCRAVRPKPLNGNESAVIGPRRFWKEVLLIQQALQVILRHTIEGIWRGDRARCLAFHASVKCPYMILRHPTSHGSQVVLPKSASTAVLCYLHALPNSASGAANDICAKQKDKATNDERRW